MSLFMKLCLQKSDCDFIVLPAKTEKNNQAGMGFESTFEAQLFETFQIQCL